MSETEIENVVLDASAVLAMIFDEPGGEAVRQLVEFALISAVNLSETAAKLAERGFQGTDIRDMLAGLGFTIVPFTESDAFEAAELRAPTRGLGLSFGDRACIALAARSGLVAVTCDRAFTGASAHAEIRLVR